MFSIVKSEASTPNMARQAIVQVGVPGCAAADTDCCCWLRSDVEVSLFAY